MKFKNDTNENDLQNRVIFYNVYTAGYRALNPARYGHCNALIPNQK